MGWEEEEEDVEDLLEESEGMITWAREKLMILAAASPRTIRDTDGYPVDWEDYIQKEVTDIMDVLLEEIPVRYICLQELEGPEIPF